eukprot:CAMPEP_0184331016 /NCGR_PEP_ID=MMETSP1089-20130417/298_1 /TAXON_ID=38269 ORGANISM="Gloeochaete wittrockiana, Strain SAG46.84" /NCGR_SAMPLE_ID=MMETSP1089 /ASSEMBLY_ACC=CAM_ASM_000445 /LENGTH=102 /DNA_ID=CAMNT_0026653597 /DNA_START=48 /DNA_END=356 /DNA_ORIENTATION=-
MSLLAKITPLFDRVLIKRLVPAAQTASGIALPESARDKFPRAEVIAVGSGRLGDGNKAIPISLKKGDHVLIPDSIFSATELKIEGNQYLLIREDDILAKIEQ